MKLPQRHKIGTNTFIFDDDLHIIGADDKPIKFVYEGNCGYGLLRLWCFLFPQPFTASRSNGCAVLQRCALAAQQDFSGSSCILFFICHWQRNWMAKWRRHLLIAPITVIRPTTEQR